MYVLTVALYKYTFILTLKQINSTENANSKQAKKSSVFHMLCKLI